MSGLQLEKYSGERDRQALLDMLGEDLLQAQTGRPGMDNHPDCVYLAWHNGRAVGYMAMMNGFQRRTHMAIYVRPAYRRQGVGSAMLRLSDKLFADHEIVELSCGVCQEHDRDAIQMLYRNGYYRGHGALTMVRRGEVLPETDLPIRAYEEGDHPAWHRVYESAFWPMRAATGQFPVYYFPPSDDEARYFSTIRDNLFVLPINGEIVAIGRRSGRHLYTIAVRPDVQGRGYGRGMASFLINRIMEQGEPMVELGVVQGNTAIALYESLGFVVTERLTCMKRYYRPDTTPSAPPEGFFGDIFR